MASTSGKQQGGAKSPGVVSLDTRFTSEHESKLNSHETRLASIEAKLAAQEKALSPTT
jgi:hypothetical protein